MSISRYSEKDEQLRRVRYGDVAAFGDFSLLAGRRCAARAFERRFHFIAIAGDTMLIALPSMMPRQRAQSDFDGAGESICSLQRCRRLIIDEMHFAMAVISAMASSVRLVTQRRRDDSRHADITSISLMLA